MISMLLLFKLLSSHRLLRQPKEIGINGISGRTTSTFPLQLCYCSCSLHQAQSCSMSSTKFTHHSNILDGDNCMLFSCHSYKYISKMDPLSTTRNFKIIFFFMFFELCIVVHLCNKNQQNAHFLH